MISEEISFDEGIEIINCIVKDENIATVNLDEEGKYMDVKSGKKIGTTEIKLIDKNEKEYIYIVNSTSKNFDTFSNFNIFPLLLFLCVVFRDCP